MWCTTSFVRHATSHTLARQHNYLIATRVREHKAAVKKGESATSAVAEPVWEEHHQMDFNNVTVLARETNKDQRCCLESWFIQRNSTINREL